MIDWLECRFGEVTNIAIGEVDPRTAPYCDYYYIGPENIQTKDKSTA